MLSNIAVLLCFALATASAVGPADGLKSLRNHAEEARSALSTLSEQCTTDSDIINTEYVKALYNIFNCSYSEVIDGAANIALETGAYAVMDYKTISSLLKQFSSCAELNPLKSAECFYREFVQSYGDIHDMIVSTKNFIDDMKSMIPPLKEEIDNCFSFSSTEYKNVLNNLVHKARKCEKNL